MKFIDQIIQTIEIMRKIRGFKGWNYFHGINAADVLLFLVSELFVFSNEDYFRINTMTLEFNSTFTILFGNLNNFCSALK